MAGGSDQERTERATPKRRERARNQGQVARSREVATVAILLAGLATASFTGAWFFRRLVAIMRAVFLEAGTTELNPVSLTQGFAAILVQVLLLISPLLAAVFVASLAGTIVQVGFHFTAEPMRPNPGRLNPVKGMKQLFSLSSLFESVKSLTKILIIGGVVFLVLRRELHRVPGLMQLETGQILSFVGHVAFDITLYTLVVMTALAALDFCYQKWRYEKDLRMTRQEVKDEHRQNEGDPKIRSRIRSIQLEMARQRMMAMVPEASVVVTNPVHLAVALKYEIGRHAAPQVVAKGGGHVAEKIKAIAREHQIPIVENKPLARAIFKATDVGDTIPTELYRSVAEVLAYVYRLDARHAAHQSSQAR